ncbi:UDP:flavonoid glycosyltransferase YjiC (YdhE family) [Amycolatopsis bartoniae]|uniref:Glycosyl transferase n=1 Tax=Amycolatopsis bartoniae TaxID=941986 RepID=A0A8H9J6B9_9PSEU|nr:glycosyltransferase [Amycolatopsis bartoniae]MBB2936142.1 UDP:flavonoid glycosyltransferase YjiC (YdhE family) [Amycolatopsis bartoniae]TVT07144.1 glycosyltransferase family 1 protein [Amycolatopsis bartoniae]GHF81264.1 glycosyl transferase [Amycolatopsis bartoniae]
MRVLFTSVPAYGHLLPLLPTAVAARAAGDEVAVSTGASMGATVGDLPFLPAGPEIPELFAEQARRPGAGDPTDATDLAGVTGLFSDTRIDLGFDAALAAAKGFQAEVIVSDVVDLVAPLVAAALGIPWVVHGITVEFPPPMVQSFFDGMTRQAEARGLRVPSRAALLELWPSFLQHDGYRLPDDGIALRPLPYRPPGSAPAPLPRGERPRVLITLGTTADMSIITGKLLASLSALDVEVVVTGAAVPDAPEDVRFVGFTPLADLLEGTDAVVTAGGAGTVIASLSHGIPMVALPTIADQPVLAERAASAGAALVLDPSEAEDRLASALRTVLDDPAPRSAAREVAARIAELPAPEAAWAELHRRLAQER